MKKPPQILLTKVGEGLYGGDPITDEYIGQIGQHKQIVCQPWLPRSPQFHRAAMVYLHLVLENNDRFDNFDDLMTWLKLKCGLFTMFAGVHGDTYRLVESIAFSQMDEVHFRRFMNRAQYYVDTELIPGLVMEEAKKQFIAECQRKELEYGPLAPATPEDQG